VAPLRAPNGNIFDGFHDRCNCRRPTARVRRLRSDESKAANHEHGHRSWEERRDLLNAKGITWGWFQGGFAPTGADAKGRAVCGSHHVGLAGDDVQKTVGDLHSAPRTVEYYAQTTNQHHLRPSSVAKIGQNDQANHQYDITDFFDALKEGHLPAVQLPQGGRLPGRARGYSDPIDEQIFVVGVINALMQSKE